MSEDGEVLQRLVGHHATLPVQPAEADDDVGAKLSGSPGNSQPSSTTVITGDVVGLVGWSPG